MDVITSRENPRIKRACALRDFRKTARRRGALFCRRPQALPGARPGAAARPSCTRPPPPWRTPRRWRASARPWWRSRSRWPKSSPERAARRACSRCLRPPPPTRPRCWPRRGASWRWKPCRTPATSARCCAAPPPSALTPCCWARAARPRFRQGAARFDGRGGPPAARRLRRPARGARRAARPRRRLPGRRAVQGPPAGRCGHAVPRRGLRRYRQRGPIRISIARG